MENLTGRILPVRPLPCVVPCKLYFTTAQTVYVQEITEPNVLGRVFSIIQIASTSALPIAILFLGPLADIISVQSMLFVSGILFVICGALYGRLR